MSPVADPVLGRAVGTLCRDLIARGMECRKNPPRCGNHGLEYAPLQRQPPINAGIAQLVEQRIRTADVVT